MYDELTQVDIDKMKEELEYRIGVVRPKILEEVKFTRSFGDKAKMPSTMRQSVNGAGTRAE